MKGDTCRLEKAGVSECVRGYVHHATLLPAATLMKTKLAVLMPLIPSAGWVITSAHLNNVTHGARECLATSHSAAMDLLSVHCL
jgi:hypothetical protein